MSSVRVFLCDDSAAFRALVAAWLGPCDGVEVVGEAPDGQAAVERIADAQADVLLLDVDMPGRGGLDALPELRRAAPATRVLMLTGHDEPAVRTRATALGASDVLVKGLPPDALVEAVRAAA
jgi:two-component system, NarL family, response regulator DesR